MASKTKDTQARNPTGASAPRGAKADADQADIAPAKAFSPSGAPEQTVGIDAEHPAVDANPREATTVDQNRIDFNDPTLSGAEAVARNLEEQGMTVARTDGDEA